MNWRPYSSICKVDTLPSVCVILIQGSARLLDLCPSNWFTSFTSLYSGALGSSLNHIPVAFVPSSLQHRSCGGVTDGCWPVATTWNLTSSFPVTLSRQIRHIVDITTSLTVYNCCRPPGSSFVVGDLAQVLSTFYPCRRCVTGMDYCLRIGQRPPSGSHQFILLISGWYVLFLPGNCFEHMMFCHQCLLIFLKFLWIFMLLRPLKFCCFLAPTFFVRREGSLDELGTVSDNCLSTSFLDSS